MSAAFTEEWLADYQARTRAQPPLVPRYPADHGEMVPPPEPFELTPPPVYRGNRRLEEALQSAIVKSWRPLLVRGAKLLATNGELPGGAEMVDRAKRRKGMGYTRGTPDLLARRRGALVWLEVKVPPNKPTAEQAQFATWAIDECGDGWAVATSIDDAGAVLRAWGMV